MPCQENSCYMYSNCCYAEQWQNVLICVTTWRCVRLVNDVICQIFYNCLLCVICTSMFFLFSNLQVALVRTCLSYRFREPLLSQITMLESLVLIDT